MSYTYRRHLIVIGLYLLLTLLLTWPLAAHLPSRVPGEATWAFDEYTFIWNMWWFKHSLLTLGQTPLETNHLFFPLGIRLTTYTFNLFNAAFGLPLQLALSLPLASNLTLIFSYLSSAYGMFLLTRYLLSRPETGDRRPHPFRVSWGLTTDRQPPTGISPSSLTIDHSQLTIDNYLASFAAGAVYAFSASRMMYLALGHYNFVTIQWFPFYTLFLLKTLRGGGWKNSLLAGLFAAFCLYAELTFSVFLLFITLILFIAESASQRMGESANGRISEAHFAPPLPRSPAPLRSLRVASLLLRLIPIGLTAFLLTAPFLLAVLPDFLNPAYAEPGWGEGVKLSADLAGLVTPTPLHPLYSGEWLAELRAVIEGRGRFSDVNTLFLGYGILALALLGFLTNRKAGRVWLWSALIFAVLSLGPLLTINSQNRFNLDGLDVTFPMPFALLHYVPLINANRVPNRFGIPLTLALAVLAGFAVSRITCQVSGVRYQVSRITPPKAHKAHALRTTHYAPRFTLYASRFTLHAFLLALLLFDQVSVPLPLTDARIPDVYRQIGAEPGNFTLLQLPLGWRNSYGTLGAEQTQLEYYQSAHLRPMLGGNTSRNPAFKFDYYANIPLFKALTEAELYRPVDETTLQRAREQAAELMTLYHVKYLVIHEPIPQRKPYEDTYEATRKLALDLIPHQPRPVYQSPGVQAFAVQPAELPNPLALDFGDWRSDPYRGEGWAGNEEVFGATANWATAAEAVIFFPAQGGGERRLSLHIAPFAYPGMPAQTVRLQLNDQLLAGSYPLLEGWQSIEAVLPAAALLDGLNRLTLHFDHTAQPRQVLPAAAAIGQTGVTTPVDVEVNSGSDFAFITVGFGPAAEDASAHRRGVNVAVLAPDTGRVIASRGFDTAANAYEAAALRQFIQEIPDGQLVALATQGVDATTFFDAETWASLQTLGLSTGSLTPPFSAIGVKGAPAGTALSATAGSSGTAYLRLGPSPDTRSLAAAVDKVTIIVP